MRFTASLRIEAAANTITLSSFYLYDFEAVLAAVRKHYQVDAAQP